MLEQDPWPPRARSLYGRELVPQPNTLPATAAAGLVVPVLGRQIGRYWEVLIVALNFSSTRLAFLGWVMFFRTPRILLQEMAQGEIVLRQKC